VTKAVHAAGGKIVLQLWLVGRISDPIYLNGELPVAPSAIKPAGHVSLVRPMKDFVTPRALETEEIADIVEAYRQGAENAKAAGFDGVEIHGANGYLLDQFLQSSTNQRTDQYGGSLENRARLLLEVTDAAIEVWGAGRVGVHLAPRADSHDMGDANRAETFSYVARELGKRGIAFICAREKAADDSLSPMLKQAFGGVFIANERFTKEQANAWIAEGKADAVAFGIPFIATGLASAPGTGRRTEHPTPGNLLRPRPGWLPGLSNAVSLRSHRYCGRGFSRESIDPKSPHNASPATFSRCNGHK
jgi:2,4-dienoyl-CoA reductase-like NADH-dependent reductase (Old Yellow Enzyme family)